MDARLLRELQERGRFFYERFPGAAAAEKAKRERERAEQEQLAPSPGDRGSEGGVPGADAPRTSTAQRSCSTPIAGGIIVTRIARSMVGRWGISEPIGRLSVLPSKVIHGCPESRMVCSTRSS